MIVSQLQPAIPQRKDSQQMGFGSLPLPWDAVIARNPVFSRIAVEWLGVFPGSAALSRNKYETAERFMDSFSWMIIGMLMPVALDKVLNRWYTRKLIQNHSKSFVPSAMASFNKSAKNITPLGIPFEMLDKANFAKVSKQTQTLAQYGLKEMPKALANKILNGKLFIIMLIDYLGLWAKANLYSFGKNWVTEKFSGKKGFSGELKMTDDKYREKQSAAYEKNKKSLLVKSLSLSFLGSISFPFILLGLLKNKTPATAKNAMGKVKSLIPWFNYTDIVFLSKYALMWQVFWNHNLTGFLAARDNHERREHVTKCIAGDAFFFVGDDFISGYFAKWAQKKYGKQFAGFNLLHAKRGLFGNPNAKGFHEIIREAANIKNPIARQKFINWGRTIFAVGIIGTSLGMGLSMTFLNNLYTRQKIQREQEEEKAKQATKMAASHNANQYQPFLNYPQQPMVVQSAS